MPLDVRKGSAFPMFSSGEFSEATPRECLGGIASNKLPAFTESHRLSAHRAAQPQAPTSATANGSLSALHQRFARDFLVVKVKNLAPEDLIVLMAFAGDQD